MIYIAAPYTCREDADLLAQRLQQAGLSVCSTWHRPTNNAPVSVATDEQTACRLHHAALKNLREINRAEAVILLEYSQGGAGCYWETGYAYRMGLPIHVVQPQRCIYNLLATYTWTRGELDDMIERLTQDAAANTLEEAIDDALCLN